jgi:hypothetical protein
VVNGYSGECFADALVEEQPDAGGTGNCCL